MKRDNFNNEDEKNLEIIKESISIDKEIVETGKVKVEVSTQEIPVEEYVNLTSTNYDIQRIKKNDFVDAPIDIVKKNGKTIISVVEEVLVVEKRLKLVEEIHIIENNDVKETKITDTLRKQKAIISK